MSHFATGHVGLNVSNLAQSSAFYQQVFGFRTVGESSEAGREFVFLGNGERLVLTLWQQSAGRFASNRPGLHHLAFQVESIEDVVSIEKNLREQQIPIIYDRIVPHGEGQQSAALYFEDPDGIRLEVYSPTGGEVREAPDKDGPSCGFY